MSRHLLPSAAGSEPGTETVAGWDQRLHTYFLQINPPSNSDAVPVLLGTDFDEFYDPDDFLDVLTQHGIATPDKLIAVLYWDRDLGRMNVITDWRSGDPVNVSQPSASPQAGD